ncbi:MAG: hydrogenase maturation protease [Candidatus Limnocylindrales bacterium]
MDEPGRTTTLVLGLGNPILGDDGVGWRVLDELEARLRVASGTGPGGHAVPGVDALSSRVGGSRGTDGVPGGAPWVELDRLALGGLRLMERLVGYEQAILVDAIATGGLRPGSVRCLHLGDLPASGDARLASPHDTSLAAALDLGRQLGAPLPEAPWVVAIEAGPGFEFSTQLSPAVARAVPHAADAVLRLLGESGGAYPTASAPGAEASGRGEQERRPQPWVGRS